MTTAEETAKDVALAAIDRIHVLRSAIKDALDERNPAEARRILDAVLAKTDVGKMKVWQKGEEPF